MYQIQAEVCNGDYVPYAVINIGESTITAYQSVVRPGGITIDIDGEHAFLITVNDFLAYESSRKE